MRFVLVIAAVVCMVGLAAGQDLGKSAPVEQLPAKGEPTINLREYVLLPQGGDTFDNARHIAGVPFSEWGTTARYHDDYDEQCPYSGSTSPDVVYRLKADDDMVIEVDLCGSSYDTKVYMYDIGLNLIACNDDFYFNDICGTYVSKLENVNLTGGCAYYIVIDGYGGDFGDYLLDIQVFLPCELECPGDATLEGEPALMDGYVDSYNGGCNTDDVNPLDYVQVVQAGEFCGTSGWYDNPDGGEVRDTDWFVITLSEDGFFEWRCDAEEATHMFELLNMPDCGDVTVGQLATAGPCLPAYMLIFGAPGDEVYFWIGPTVFVPPGGFIGYEYDYVCYFSTSIHDIKNATETSTWSQLKAMYR